MNTEQHPIPVESELTLDQLDEIVGGAGTLKDKLETVIKLVEAAKAIGEIPELAERARKWVLRQGVPAIFVK